MESESIVISLILLPVILFVGWRSLEILNTWQEAAVYILFFNQSLECLFFDTPGATGIVLGGFNIYPPDLAAVGFLIVAILRFWKGHHALDLTTARVLLGFAAILFMNHLRGLAEYGPKLSTNEFREFIYFISACLFGAAMPIGTIRTKLSAPFLWGNIGLIAVAFARAAQLGGFSTSFDTRPLPSGAAVVLSQAFFLGWIWLFECRRNILAWVYTIGLLPFSALLLHRSVWSATLCGLVALFLFDKTRRKYLAPIGMIGLVVGGGLALVMLGNKLVESLGSSVSEVSNDNSTLSWRIQGWIALLDPNKMSNPIVMLFGFPMGHGYARELGEHTISIEAEVVPHNFYLTLFLRSGVVGLSCFVWLLYTTIKKLLAHVRVEPVGGVTLGYLCMLVVQAVYFMPYNSSATQGFLLGTGIALSMQSQSEYETDFNGALAT